METFNTLDMWKRHQKEMQRKLSMRSPRVARKIKARAKRRATGR